MVHDEEAYQKELYQPHGHQKRPEVLCTLWVLFFQDPSHISSGVG